MKEFIFDIVLDEENICNLRSEKETLVKGILKGKHFVVYGRRNVGKTSVLKSIVKPKFLKKNKNAFVMFADLMGVKTLSQIEQRLYSAFQRGFLDSSPTNSVMKSVFETLKNLRPTLTLDPITGPTLSLGIANDQKPPSLQKIFDGIVDLQKKFPCLIILDEFQDIHFVEQAEALLRDCLQNLPQGIPIIISGSKKHILSRIFSRPQAPFSGFGEDVEFQEISYSDYHLYMNERLKPKNLKISLEVSTYLQDLLLRVPESINIVCSQITSLKENTKGVISVDDVNRAVRMTLESRRSRFEEFLSHYSTIEEKVMITLAKFTSIQNPSGKDFVSSVGASQAGVSKIIKKFEDEATVYKLKAGYTLADPLLQHYLRAYR